MKEKITMYDLFGLIKDNKTPETIILKGEVYDIDHTKPRLAYKSRKTGYWLCFGYYIEENKLNEEVEIIEE